MNNKLTIIIKIGQFAEIMIFLTIKKITIKLFFRINLILKDSKIQKTLITFEFMFKSSNNILF